MAAAPVLYSHGEPSSQEQYALELLNRARLDPAGEGQRLAAWLRLPRQASTVALYQIDLNRLIADFQGYPAVAPLAFNPQLIAAARAHSRDLAPHDGQGPAGDDHAGYDGSDPSSRVQASGYTGGLGANEGGGFAGENFGPGADDVYGDHAGYLVDWGNPGLGHRRISLYGDNVREVGIGLASKPAGLDDLYPLVSTQDFGLPGYRFTGKHATISYADAPAFLVGVVYADANGNGEYDPGEGVAGVRVSMQAGAYYTLTSASGGYALPLINADGSPLDGIATVSMSALPGGSTTSRSIKAAMASAQYGSFRANQKWDFVLGGTVAPPTGGDGFVVTVGQNGELSRSAGGRVVVTVRRGGSTDLSQPVVVRYQVKGSAQAGVDYVPLPGVLTIPAGAAKAKIKVRAIAGSTGGPTTVILCIKGASGGKAIIHLLP